MVKQHLVILKLYGWLLNLLLNDIVLFYLGYVNFGSLSLHITKEMV